MTTLKEIKKYTYDLSVLYVEDDKTIRDSMKVLLQLFFKEVDTAVDGEDGLNMFNTKTYDILITDILMPKIDGIELMKNVRQTNEKIPIIVTTALPKDGGGNLGFQDLHVDAYIIKPLSSDLLKNAIYSIAKSFHEKRKHANG